jgi:glyoxylase-like metal-dependent hydrolase (beta-lactamase superfamily II)
VAEQDLREGETLSIGALRFRVLHTPGHTEGSVCLYEANRSLLLAGDVLFRGSCGRIDLPGGDEQQMVSSLKRLLGEVPSNTRILPGHGPETTMATEVPWMVRIARSGFLAISD